VNTKGGMQTMQISYLASPYSSPSPALRRARYIAAVVATKELMQQGKVVYSPIVHWHMQTTMFDLPFDYLTWKGQNDPMMDVSGELLILQIEGWKESKGVQNEIQVFKNNNKPISNYWLQNTFSSHEVNVEYHELEARIAKITKESLENINRKTRVQHIMIYKHIARYLFTVLNPHFSNIALAKKINLHHSTMRASMQVVKDLLFSNAYDKTYRAIYEMLLNDLSADSCEKNNIEDLAKIA